MALIRQKFRKGYRWVGYNPFLDDVNAEIRRSGMSYADIAKNGGPTESTLSKWGKRKTRRPYHDTLERALNACGMETTIQPMRKKKKNGRG